MTGRRLVSGLGLSGVALLAAACGAETEEPGDPVVAGQSLASLVAAGDRGLHEPFPDPAAMLEAGDVAVWGTVESVGDGRVLDGGNGLTTSTVVIGIAPVDLVKDDPHRRGDLVYLGLERPEATAVSEYAAQLPEGSSLALVGWSAESTQRVIDPDAGREPGSSIYRAFPDGLWWQTADGLEGTIGEEQDPDWTAIHSWDELEARLTD